jgi:hypothetical protein
VTENPTSEQTIGRFINFAFDLYVSLSEEQLTRKLALFDCCAHSRLPEGLDHLLSDTIRACDRYRGIEAHWMCAEGFRAYKRVIQLRRMTSPSNTHFSHATFR